MGFFLDLAVIFANSAKSQVIVHEYTLFCVWRGVHSDLIGVLNVLWNKSKEGSNGVDAIGQAQSTYYFGSS